MTGSGTRTCRRPCCKKRSILEQSVRCCGSLSILKAGLLSLVPLSLQLFPMLGARARAAWRGLMCGTRCSTMPFVNPLPAGIRSISTATVPLQCSGDVRVVRLGMNVTLIPFGCGHDHSGLESRHRTSGLVETFDSLVWLCAVWALWKGHFHSGVDSARACPNLGYGTVKDRERGPATEWTVSRTAGLNLGRDGHEETGLFPDGDADLRGALVFLTGARVRAVDKRRPCIAGGDGGVAHAWLFWRWRALGCHLGHVHGVHGRRIRVPRHHSGCRFKVPYVTEKKTEWLKDHPQSQSEVRQQRGTRELAMGCSAGYLRKDVGLRVVSRTTLRCDLWTGFLREWNSHVQF